MATSPSYFGDYSDRSQPTLNTVNDYVTEARTILQDIVGDIYRYDDPSLVRALNIALLEGRKERADLFVFNTKVNGQTQSFKTVDDTYVDLEPQFRSYFLYGMIGHALMRDQEDYQDARATSFLSLFRFGLTGRGMPPIMGGSGPGRQQ
jgi:hypothetical protein